METRYRVNLSLDPADRVVVESAAKADRRSVTEFSRIATVDAAEALLGRKRADAIRRDVAAGVKS